MPWNELTLQDFFNLGTLGGALFFGSWLLQAWESKQKGKSIVSLRFWLVRLTGILLMMVYSFQIQSLIFVITYGITGIVTMFNIYIYLKNGNSKSR